MLFRRRTRATPLQRLRVWLWPRASWRRSARYYSKRTLRLSGTPHAIALGAAAGCFASFTPLIGVHIVLALALAWILRGNLLAAAIGTAVGNPLTFPVIWAATYEAGAAIAGDPGAEAPPQIGEAVGGMSLSQLRPILEPMLLGAAPLGLCAGGILYLVVYKAVSVYQRGRRQRFADRRAAARSEPDAVAATEGK